MDVDTSRARQGLWALIGRGQRAGEAASVGSQSPTQLLALADEFNASLEPAEAVRRAVEMAARHFGSLHAAFWAVDPATGFVRLVHWLIEGEVTDKEELLRRWPMVASTWELLWSGFQVPECYLGAQPGSRRRVATVVDHVQGTAVPAFDHFAMVLGAPMELNVPVLVGGLEHASFTVFKSMEAPFSPAEIAFAEGLAARLALAVAAQRLAVLSGEQAERDTRAEELALSASVMSHALSLVAEKGDLQGILGEVCREASRATGARAVTIFAVNQAGDAIEMRALLIDGQRVDIQSDLNRPYRDPLPIAGFLPERLLHLRAPTWIDYTSPPDDDYPQSQAWHQSQRHRYIAFVPMWAIDKPLGFLGLAFRDDGRDPRSIARMSFIESLAQHASHALLIDRMMRAAKAEADSRERAQVAEAVAERHSRSTAALQAVLDVIDRTESIDEITAAAFSAFSRAQGAAVCGLWVHGADGRVRLQEWARDGERFAWDELFRRVAPAHAAAYQPLLVQMREGLAIPQPYLGVDVQCRVSPVRLDHATGTAEPRFDRFACDLGLPLELNVGLVASGRAFGALTVYRPADWPFDASDVQLAEVIAPVMSIAQRSKDVAVASRTLAVAASEARGREAVAQGQLAELSRANERLRSLVRETAAGEPGPALVQRMLQSLAELTGAHSAAVFCLEDGGLWRTMALVLQGQPLDLQTDERARLWREPFCDHEFPAGQGVITGDETVQAMSLDELAPRLWPPSVAWHRQHGVVALAMSRLLFGAQTLGFVGYGFTSTEVDIADAVQEHVRSINHQLALVLQLDAAAARQARAAVDAERIEATQRRLDDLTSANQALSQALSLFAERPEIDSFLPALTIAAQTQAGAYSNAVFAFDAATRSFSLVAYSRQGQLLNVGSDPDLAIWRDPVPWEDSPKAHETFARGGAVSHDVPDIGRDPLAWPRAVQFHQQQGHGSVYCLPMRVGDTLLGFMGLCFLERADILPTRIEIAAALTQQATLALFVSERAASAKASALALERERVLSEQREQHRLAVLSMQRVIDSLDASATLEDVVPRALSVVRSVFDAQTVGLYELTSDRVFLNYVLVQGSAYGPGDADRLERIGGPLGETLRWLTKGFDAPDHYLGSPAGTRRSSVFLDHASGSTVPYFDEMARWLGASELNVPLRAVGMTFGALVIYRPAGVSFTDDERVLAEVMARQLALAMRSGRLAAEAREEAVRTAVAVEQARSARQRVQQLSRANAAARANLDALGRTASVNDFLPQLALAAQIQSRARTCAVFVRVGTAAGLALKGFAAFGETLPLADLRLRVWAQADFIEQLPAFKHMVEQGQTSMTVQVPVVLPGQSIRPELDAFHAAFGHRTLHVSLLSVEGEPLGFMGLGFGANDELDDALLEVAASLALQGALAYWVSRRAEIEASLAVAQKAREAAEAQATQHAWAIATLQSSIDALSPEQDMEAYVPEVARVLGSAMRARAIGVYRVSDGVCRLFAGWLDGKPMSSADIRAMDPMRFALVHALADGFGVTDEYLDAGKRTGSRSRIVDHSGGTPRPELERFLGEHGWTKELNVPLLTMGKVFGALCIYKPAEETFTESEVSLAESVAAQLSLALQAAENANQARQRAVETAAARERAAAARERVRETSAANLALKRGLDALSGSGMLGDLLASLVPAMLRVVRARRGYRLSFDADLRELALHDIHDHAGAVAWRSDVGQGRWSRPMRAEQLPIWSSLQLGPTELQGAQFEDALALPRPAAESAADVASLQALVLPMRVGGELIGLLILEFTNPDALSEPQRLMAEALALEVTLAVHLTALSDRARHVATLEERTRLAREMHDTLAQGFTGILMQLEVAAAATTAGRAALASDAIGRAADLARDSLGEARRVVRALRSPTLFGGGLVTALQALVRSHTETTSLPVALKVDGEATSLDQAVEEQLLRIAQESLVNVSRHAHAQQAWLDLAFTPAAIRLTVRDDGIGWDGEPPRTGFGLMGIRERAASIGAEATLQSAAGRGTTIQVTLKEQG